MNWPTFLHPRCPVKRPEPVTGVWSSDTLAFSHPHSEHLSKIVFLSWPWCTGHGPSSRLRPRCQWWAWLHPQCMVTRLATLLTWPVTRLSWPCVSATHSWIPILVASQSNGGNLNNYIITLRILTLFSPQKHGRDGTVLSTAALLQSLQHPTQLLQASKDSCGGEETWKETRIFEV